LNSQAARQDAGHELSILSEITAAPTQNRMGLIVGISGLCSNTLFNGLGVGPHAVMWDHGRPIFLGNLGDSSTDMGHVAAMQDKGLMSDDPGDAQNTPFGVNNHGQLVGASCDVIFGMCRGYLWQNDQCIDLNTLMLPDTKLFIALNDRRDITGMAMDTDTGEPRVFLATPVHGANNGYVASVRRGNWRLPAMPNSFRDLFQCSRPRGHPV